MSPASSRPAACHMLGEEQGWMPGMRCTEAAGSTFLHQYAVFSTNHLSECFPKDIPGRIIA